MRITIPFAFFTLLVLVAGCDDTRRAPRRDAGNPSVDSGGCGALTDCSGTCADLDTDRNNCGGCGNACETGEACFGGLCEACTASCEGRMCGDDGCGGSCGTCPGGTECVDGTCEIACVPDCNGFECGDDGCGGTCGSCPSGSVCEGPACFETCTPTCEGRECGDDGCGGSCGSCPSGTVCADGFCESTCTPSCVGRSCGTDGCGGSCGTCPSGFTCGSSGTCTPTCTPSCIGRTCGTDGCGGSCGTCPSGMTCGSSGTCTGGTGGGESCSTATLVSSSGGTYSFTFSGHTANHTPLGCGSTSGQPDVAFRFTPTFSGTATFETSGSNDTVMSVFSSSICSSTSELMCNDDGSGTGLNSLITMSVTGGVTYYIVIAPYGTTTPSGSSSLTVTAP